MRYSQIIGEVFYNIGLSDADQALVDVHFTAAAHHFHRMAEAISPTSHRFHSIRLVRHLSHLRSVVFERGNFLEATDASLRGLESREAWNPDETVGLIDPRMFNSMRADPDFRIDQEHPNDTFLVYPVSATYPANIRFAN